MAAGRTYTPISTTTLTSTQSSVTFSSIPSTYTDLVLVANIKAASSDLYPQITINGSGANISRLYLLASAANAAISSMQSDNYLVGQNMIYSAGFYYNSITHFMSYSNTNTYKTILSRNNNSSRGTELLINGWRSTSAINSFSYYGSSNFDIGSTFTLYGIAAA